MEYDTNSTANTSTTTPSSPYHPRRYWRHYMRPGTTLTPEEDRANYFAAYEPMTGIRIAATLGIIISLFTLFLIYKSKCRPHKEPPPVTAVLECGIDSSPEADRKLMSSRVDEGARSSLLGATASVGLTDPGDNNPGTPQHDRRQSARSRASSSSGRPNPISRRFSGPGSTVHTGRLLYEEFCPENSTQSSSVAGTDE